MHTAYGFQKNEPSTVFQVLLVQGLLKRVFTFVYISAFVPIFTITIEYSEQSILEKANPSEKGLFRIEVGTRSTSEACLTFADCSVFRTFSRVRLGILLNALRHYHFQTYDETFF